MKKLMSLAAVAAVLTIAGSAMAYDVTPQGPEQMTPPSHSPLYKESGHCDAFHQEVPVWGWDHATHKFTFEGYECKTVPNGGN